MNPGLASFTETLSRNSAQVLDLCARCKPCLRNTACETSSLEPQSQREEGRKDVFLAQLEQVGRLQDESSVLRFRHRLKRHELSKQILLAVNELLIERGLLFSAEAGVDATLIATPTSKKKQRSDARPRDALRQEGHQVLLWCESSQHQYGR